MANNKVDIQKTINDIIDKLIDHKRGLRWTVGNKDNVRTIVDVALNGEKRTNMTTRTTETTAVGLYDIKLSTVSPEEKAKKMQMLLQACIKANNAMPNTDKTLRRILEEPLTVLNTIAQKTKKDPTRIRIELNSFNGKIKDFQERLRIAAYAHGYKEGSKEYKMVSKIYQALEQCKNHKLSVSERENALLDQLESLKTIKDKNGALERILKDAVHAVVTADPEVIQAPKIPLKSAKPALPIRAKAATTPSSGSFVDLKHKADKSSAVQAQSKPKPALPPLPKKPEKSLPPTPFDELIKDVQAIKNSASTQGSEASCNLIIEYLKRYNQKDNAYWGNRDLVQRDLTDIQTKLNSISNSEPILKFRCDTLKRELNEAIQKKQNPAKPLAKSELTSMATISKQFAVREASIKNANPKEDIKGAMVAYNKSKAATPSLAKRIPPPKPKNPPPPLPKAKN